MLRAVRMLSLCLLSSLTLAAPLTVGGVSVTGSGQSYAALSSVASWQGIELPVAALAGFDLDSLTITALGLTVFKLQDAAGHSVTFEQAVS